MIWKGNDKTATKGKTSIFSVNEELHINGVSILKKYFDFETQKTNV